MGPPRAPPKVLRSRRGRGMPERLLKKSLAVKMVLRCASKSAACHSLEPDLVTSEICAPDERPCVELAFEVTTRNSSMASELRRSTGEEIELVCASLMS